MGATNGCDVGGAIGGADACGGATGGAVGGVDGGGEVDPGIGGGVYCSAGEDCTGSGIGGGAKEGCGAAFGGANDAGRLGTTTDAPGTCPYEGIAGAAVVGCCCP